MNAAHTASPAGAVGFSPEEIDQGAPTRAARLRWVVVVDSGLPPGRAVNAAVCAGAATALAVTGLLGEDATDSGGGVHPGLPWAGCTVLTAGTAALRAIRAAAQASADTFVADMPQAAQRTRVYTDYLDAMGRTAAEDVDYCAVSIVGPRRRIDRIVGRLPLMP
ncbi:DUF2000 domain-containing protein [Streptomyces sp. NPDC046977]|uniref:DUF2000 domain-containing protein n=1 Tax=Streptomyces sp. NPDC046977 TaxID=3154703 RepID=UPI0033C753F6